MKIARCRIGGSGLALGLLMALTSCTNSGEPSAATKPETRTAKVEVRKTDGKYQLFVNNQPFQVKGAGLEFGSQEKLAAHGGNTFRTWRTENGVESGQQVLDRALSNGLYVAMGIEVGRERHGFDYSNPDAVAKQLESIRAEVMKYKDHPALLMWIIGNELNLHSTNPKVWDAVNDISKMIHEVDPNHPTMTALAGISRELVNEIKTRAPDLDLIGIQMYADVINLSTRLKDSGWDGPYMVTEWGATGHWEVGKTAWGAPIENDSTTKADFYLKRFQKAIQSDRTQCLGSFVFLWGQKQERTPTWYGMFLESGEQTATVDVMHYVWNGQWPENRSPRLDGAWLDGKTANENIRLQPGRKYSAKIKARDENNDPLRYEWEILEESRDLKDGGDAESKPASLPGLITTADKSETTLTAPTVPGAYRLFGYVYDGKGAAAHVNIPFFVASDGQTAASKQDN
ncbi:MAG TPA: glycoside hydrolase family 2 TIM barrel-domain containing protein [Verrucomicrobiota bacterium]|nr:glycoside hydrolase family 2 TIM barrel-domain containing protein [Verrucomicrobiota bacterium]